MRPSRDRNPTTLFSVMKPFLRNIGNAVRRWLSNSSSLPLWGLYRITPKGRICPALPINLGTFQELRNEFGPIENDTMVSPRKIHRPQIEAVANILKRVFEDGGYADRVLENAFKSNPRWGARDRRFIAETVYTIIRHYRLLKESASCADGNYHCLIGACLVVEGHDLPAWPEFRIDPHALAVRRAELLDIRKFRESIPDWLDALGERELGTRWATELHALNQEAHLVLRANALKNTAVQLQQMLIEEGVETDLVPGFPDALIVNKRQNIFGLKAFHEGRTEV